MTEQPYSNREMDSFFTTTKAQLDRMERLLREAAEKSDKNDKEIITLDSEIKSIKFTVQVVGWVVGFLCGIFVPALLTLGYYVFSLELESIRSQIPQVVADTLNGYELEVVE